MRWLIVVVVAGCAPLNASTMSERCREIYDSCLDGCRPPPRPPGARPGEPTQLPRDPSQDLQIDVAACTNDCNQQSETCR